jgi:hypothetical protein
VGQNDSTLLKIVAGFQVPLPHAPAGIYQNFLTVHYEYLTNMPLLGAG